MSALTAEQQLQKAAIKTKSEAGLPEHVVAVFRGSYYKGVSGKFVKESFEQEIKVPIGWVNKEELDPIFIFINMFAARLLKPKDQDYGGTAEVFLKSTSNLPENMTLEKRIQWTADHSELVAMARQLRGEYRIQNDDGTLQKPIPVTIRTDLFSNTDALRTAMQELLNDARAYEIRQNKLLHATSNAEDLEAELRALGY